MTHTAPMLVSVIIPTYNYARFICAAVDSALGQTYPHVEIIVVDDGSTDDTQQRLEQYGDRIRYIYQKNQGLPVARNTAIMASRGQLIALLDSDDTWHPRKLEFQVDYLSKNPHVGALATAASDHQDWTEIEPEGFPSRLITLEDVVMRFQFHPSGVVIRKKALDVVGLFDPSFPAVEDREMWLRLASHAPLVLLHLPLHFYRTHGQNMSNRAALMEHCELRALRKAFATLPQLRRRWLLRCKATSSVYLSSAYSYDAAGLRFRSLRNILRSLLHWPLPMGEEYATSPFLRPKRLVLVLLRILKLAKPDRGLFMDNAPVMAASVARSMSANS